MKRKEIYLVVAALMLVVAGWAAWRFGASPEVVEPPANTSLSAQKTTPVTQEAMSAISHRTGRPIVSQAIETPEMRKARFSAEKSRFQASVTAMNDAQRDPKAFSNAQKDLSKPKDMAFLNSLGLSDAIRDKVYQMLRAKGDLYWDHKEQRSEALRRGETDTAYYREFRQMNADLEAAVGTENYQKIQYWEATLLERSETERFQSYLQSRGLPLTEQQEAAVVDAMHQAGRVGFQLISPSISMEEKLAYIDKVKQSLTPDLSANNVDLLGQYLQGVAESDLKMKALTESLLKRITEMKKTHQEKQMKLPNPPAPPR